MNDGMTVPPVTSLQNSFKQKLGGNILFVYAVEPSWMWEKPY